MGVYTPEQYAKKLDRIKKGLDRAARNSVEIASRFMVAKAKEWAPRDTGETVQGIRRRKNGKYKYTVESRVSGSFKQNLFANRTPPYNVLHFKKTSGNPYFHVPQDVTYGKSAKTPSGNSVHWTAHSTPFWTNAKMVTSRTFSKIARKNLHIALKG